MPRTRTSRMPEPTETRLQGALQASVAPFYIARFLFPQGFEFAYISYRIQPGIGKRSRRTTSGMERGFHGVTSISGGAIAASEPAHRRLVFKPAQSCAHPENFIMRRACSDHRRRTGEVH